MLQVANHVGVEASAALSASVAALHLGVAQQWRRAGRLAHPAVELFLVGARLLNQLWLVYARLLIQLLLVRLELQEKKFL